jgi:two-component SAPR family response regulator
MNGFELYDKIKKIDKKVKVYFISAYDVEDKVKKTVSVVRSKMLSSKTSLYSSAYEKARD